MSASGQVDRDGEPSHLVQVDPGEAGMEGSGAHSAPATIPRSAPGRTTVTTRITPASPPGNSRSNRNGLRPLPAPDLRAWSGAGGRRVHPEHQTSARRPTRSTSSIAWGASRNLWPDLQNGGRAPLRRVLRFSSERPPLPPDGVRRSDGSSCVPTRGRRTIHVALPST